MSRSDQPFYRQAVGSVDQKGLMNFRTTTIMTMIMVMIIMMQTQMMAVVMVDMMVMAMRTMEVAIMETDGGDGGNYGYEDSDVEDGGGWVMMEIMTGWWRLW